jgi:diadenosine tetraphosphatase ApaH/serine/threonine PP2A family protein phosphatase
MRIALFSDVHANREAFAACLAHAQACSADRHIFLGDHVGYGADPGWVVDTVAAHVGVGAIALRGNHDAAVVGSDEELNDVARAAIAWTRTQLTPAQCEFLRGLPLSASEADRLFVHASAWMPEAWDYVTDARAAARSFGATPQRITFCGHVHVPEIYHLSGTGKIACFTPISDTAIPLTAQWRWLAVLGAVGQPRDGIPAASYAILDEERATLTYMRVPYDAASAAAKVRAAGLPSVLSLRLLVGR